MKVTVCFGVVSVVVPCGDGKILIANLIDEATTRYRKATGKPSDHWIAVQTLKLSNGGILDPDDRVADVTDDREQIVAEFTEGVCPFRFPSAADGTSASSAGTSSPDPLLIAKEHTLWNAESSSSSKSSLPLMASPRSDAIKESKVGLQNDSVDLITMDSSSDSFARLVRARKSVMHTTMQWIESQEGFKLECIKDTDALNANSQIITDYLEIRKQENHHKASAKPEESVEFTQSVSNNLEQKSISNRQIKFLPIANTRVLGQKFEIDLVKGEDGLGISIAARDNCAEGDSPIYIKTVLPRGAAIKDGRLHPGDRLLEVNGIDVLGKSQEEVTSALRCIETGSKVILVISRQCAGQSELMDDHLLGRSITERTSILDNTLIKETVSHETGASVAEIRQSPKAGRTALSKDTACVSKNLSALCDGDTSDSFLAAHQSQTGNGKSLLSCSNIEAKSILQLEIQKSKDVSIDLVVSRDHYSSNRPTNHNCCEIADDSEHSSFSHSSGAKKLSEVVPIDENSTPNTLPQRTDVAVRNAVQNFIERKEPVQFESFVCLPGALEAEKFSSCIVDNLNHRTKTSEHGSDAVNSSHGVNKNQSHSLKENSCLRLANTKGSTSDGTSEKGDTCSDTASERDFECNPVIGFFSRDGFGRQSVSEKHKACLDPRSFNVYQQIRAGKRDNNCNLLKRCNSTDSMFSQRKITQAINNASVTCVDRPRRSNSLESVRTSSSEYPVEKLDGLMSQSNWRLEQYPRHLIYQNAAKFFLDNSLARNNGNSKKNKGSQDMAGCEMLSESKKKKKTFRGLSLVFRKLKEKKTVSSCAWMKKTEDQQTVPPRPGPKERLLQRARSEHDWSNRNERELVESDIQAKTRRLPTAEHETVEKRPELIQWIRACPCEMHVKHVARPCCSSLELGLHRNADDSIYSRECYKGFYHAHQGCIHEPNRPHSSSQEKAFHSLRCNRIPLLHSTSIPTDVLHLHEPHRSLNDRLNSSRTSTNYVLDSSGRRFTCCNVEEGDEREVGFFEGSYRKLELEQTGHQSIIDPTQDEVFYSCKHDVHKSNVCCERFDNWTTKTTSYPELCMTGNAFMNSKNAPI